MTLSDMIVSNLPGIAAGAFGVLYARHYARNDELRRTVQEQGTQIAVQAAQSTQVMKRLDEIFQLSQALAARIDAVLLERKKGN